MNMPPQFRGPSDSSPAGKRRSNFFNAFLEGFQDGLLVVTPQQQCLHRNRKAQQYCQAIAPQQTLPEQIWRICAALIESLELYPHQNCILDDLIVTADQAYRAEVQWLEPGNADSPILVTLEPQSQAQLRQSPWLEGYDWLPALA